MNENGKLVLRKAFRKKTKGQVSLTSRKETLREREGGGEEGEEGHKIACAAQYF